MKTAVITGASGGIGLALTKTFIKNGYFVIAQYNSNETSLKSLREELASGGQAEFLYTVKADFSSASGVETLFKTISSSFKKIDLLINNAGIDLYKLCEDTSATELDRIVSVNFKSAYTLTGMLTPLLRNAENASVINVSSVWGLVGACMETAYSATKSALIGMTKARAKELAPVVRVNCITPGVIKTPMNDCFTDKEMEDIISEIPLGRVGKPEEIASLSVFLASSEAEYITGAIIPIDGGYGL